MSGSADATLAVDVLETLQYLEDVQLDLDLAEVDQAIHFLLNHRLQIVFHVFKYDVLDQLVLVVPRIIEVLVTAGLQGSLLHAHNS